MKAPKRCKKSIYPTPLDQITPLTCQKRRKVKIKRRIHTWEAIDDDIEKDGEADEHATIDVYQSSMNVDGLLGFSFGTKFWWR